MGFTNDIAWGLTTGFVDSYDLFVERMQQNSYRAHDGWHKIEAHHESIAVKGAADKTVQIRNSAWRPVGTVTATTGHGGYVPADYQTSLY